MRVASLLRIVLLAAFGLFGVFLLGSGLTGLVVSESCCDPRVAGCDAANACAYLLAARPVPGFSWVGALVVLLALALAVLELHREERMKSPENDEIRLV